MISLNIRVCLTPFTIKQQSYTGKSLHWSDEQLHQSLSATLRLGLVNLDNKPL